MTEVYGSAGNEVDSMKGIMKKGAQTKKFCAVVLGALMTANILGGATEKKLQTVNVSVDGKTASYETCAVTVGDFLANENITLNPNDYISCDYKATLYGDMNIAIKKAKLVTVKDGESGFTSLTYLQTVKEVIDEMVSDPITEHDIVSLSMTEPVYDGIVIEIKRAALVKLTYEGETAEYYTFKKTVGEFLDEADKNPTAFQSVTPDRDAAVTDGMEIEIKNNKPASMSPLDYGMDLSKARVITCTATAYTSAPDETWPYSGGITATGAKCQVGVVAVDPRVIPLKSKLYIETADGSFVYGYCSAEDTGGAIKGNKVDLAMNTKAECFNFGRRTVKVYILS